MRPPTNLLILLSIISYSNAASVPPPPTFELDGILPIANISELNNATTNTTTLNATILTNHNRFIDAVKEAYTEITTHYRHAYFKGVRAIRNDAGRWTSIRVVFTNAARQQDRGIVVSIGPGGSLTKPMITDKDYGVGNKAMFVGALALDVKDVDGILRRRYPRAAYEVVFLYHPVELEGGFPDQPYWIFEMRESVLWDKYLWVGVYDWVVRGSDKVPESVTRYGGGSLTVS